MKRFLTDQIKVAKKKKNPWKYIKANNLECLALSERDLISDKKRREVRRKRELLRKTIKLLNNSVPGIIFIKTKIGYPFIDNNMDVLVKNDSSYTELRQFLAEKEFKRNPINEKYKEMWHSEDFLDVHIHKEVSWRNSIYINKRCIFASKRTVNLFGMRTPVPGKDMESMICLAHILAENMEVRAGDIIQIKFYHGMKEIEKTLDMLKSKKEVYFNPSLAYSIIKKKIKLKDLPARIDIKDLVRFRLDKIKKSARRGNLGAVLNDLFSYIIDFLLPLYHKLKEGPMK